MKQAARNLSKALREQGLPIVGVGIAEGPLLIVYLQKKVKHRIPKTFEGLPVRVKVIGRVRAFVG